MTIPTAEQRRQSRIKETRDLIMKKGLSGQLNNTKWFELFELLDKSRIKFQIKLLSDSTPRYCDFIRELEDTSILVDNTGDFVEFLEIESINFKRDDNSMDIIDSLGIQYTDKENEVVIVGYR